MNNALFLGNWDSNTLNLPKIDTSISIEPVSFLIKLIQQYSFGQFNPKIKTTLQKLSFHGNPQNANIPLIITQDDLNYLNSDARFPFLIKVFDMFNGLKPITLCTCDSESLNLIQSGYLSPDNVYKSLDKKPLFDKNVNFDTKSPQQIYLDNVDMYM